MHLTQRWIAPEIGNAVAVVLIAACGLYTFAWIFDPAMTFYADDWGWLDHAIVFGWDSFLTVWTVLPSNYFHDRRLEYIIVKLLYQLYHLDYGRYAGTLLLIHIANAVLLYALAARLLESRFYAMIAAILFVIDYDTASPAWWLSTVADSVSLFFCLCAFLAFIGRRRGSLALTVLFYFLAMKAKETALPFPFLLFAYSFLWNVASRKAGDIAQALRLALRASRSTSAPPLRRCC